MSTQRSADSYDEVFALFCKHAKCVDEQAMTRFVVKDEAYCDGCQSYYCHEFLKWHPCYRKKPVSKRAGIHPKLRFQVFERDAYRCSYCGRHLDALDVDAGEHLVVEHVVAIANGGTSDLTNLVTACNTCNAGKGTRHTERFAAHQPALDLQEATAE